MPKNNWTYTEAGIAAAHGQGKVEHLRGTVYFHRAFLGETVVYHAVLPVEDDLAPPVTEFYVAEMVRVGDVRFRRRPGQSFQFGDGRVYLRSAGGAAVAVEVKTLSNIILSAIPKMDIFQCFINCNLKNKVVFDDGRVII